MREGSGVPHLPKDFLNRFRVPEVSITTQSEFAAVMIDQREQQRVIKNQITALKKQKHGLMQQLLTGKLRVLEKVQ